MYIFQETPAQTESLARLAKDKFKFHAWIPAHPDAEGGPAEGTEEQGTMVCIKHTTRWLREYVEIEPDGSVSPCHE